MRPLFAANAGVEGTKPGHRYIYIYNNNNNNKIYYYIIIILLYII